MHTHVGSQHDEQVVENQEAQCSLSKRFHAGASRTMASKLSMPPAARLATSVTPGAVRWTKVEQRAPPYRKIEEKHALAVRWNRWISIAHQGRFPAKPTKLASEPEQNVW